jgi:hypothetical protein
LVEKVAALEKECASLELELKAAQNRYQQEVRSHEETERTRLVNKEEANLEVVKGSFLIFLLTNCSLTEILMCSVANKIERGKSGTTKVRHERSGEGAANLDALRGLPADAATVAEARGRAPAGRRKGARAARPVGVGAGQKNRTAVGDFRAQLGRGRSQDERDTAHAGSGRFEGVVASHGGSGGARDGRQAPRRHADEGAAGAVGSRATFFRNLQFYLGKPLLSTENLAELDYI